MLNTFLSRVAVLRTALCARVMSVLLPSCASSFHDLETEECHRNAITAVGGEKGISQQVTWTSAAHAIEMQYQPSVVDRLSAMSYESFHGWYAEI